MIHCKHRVPPPGGETRGHKCSWRQLVCAARRGFCHDAQPLLPKLGLKLITSGSRVDSDERVCVTLDTQRQGYRLRTLPARWIGEAEFAVRHDFDDESEGREVLAMSEVCRSTTYPAFVPFFCGYLWTSSDMRPDEQTSVGLAKFLACCSRRR